MKHIPFIHVCEIHELHDGVIICTLITFTEIQCVYIFNISIIILFNKTGERESPQEA